MPLSREKLQGRGTNPEWLNLPRRKCDQDGRMYQPTRPNSRFCSDECKRAFHRHGGAYMKLKADTAKEIKRQMGITEKCPFCKGTGKHKGLRHGVPCKNPECKNGRQLTEYGQQLIRDLEVWFKPPVSFEDRQEESPQPPRAA